MTTPFTPPPGSTVAASPTTFIYAPAEPGVNTQGAPAVTAPAVPATTVAVTNTTGLDCIIYIASGGAAVTVIKINNVATGLQLLAATTSAVTLYLPAGSNVSMTYASTAPTWVWQAA
jgi:hypothetical protein